MTDTDNASQTVTTAPTNFSGTVTVLPTVESLTYNARLYLSGPTTCEEGASQLIIANR